MATVETKPKALEKLEHDLDALLSDPNSKVGPCRVARLSHSIPELDLLGWLHRQPDVHKTYWSDREAAFAMAGIGIASEKTSHSAEDLKGLFTAMRAELSPTHDDQRYYGGFRFDMAEAEEGKWNSFGTYHFVMPEIEAGVHGNRYYLACNVLLPDTATDPEQAEALRTRLRTLDCAADEPCIESPEVVRREDTPGLESWCASVRDLLDVFSPGSLEKVVLARESLFELSDEADAVALLIALKANTAYSYHYLFQPGQGVAFIGASPERLYKRSGAFLQSEALAGTRPRGATEDDDIRLGRELLASGKELQEHRYVVDSIRDLFTDQCFSVRGGDTVELLQLRHCQHLLTRIEGELETPDSDAELLSGLHPTPAVGGIPRTEALDRISGTETFERGWYTGPVGWVGLDATEFAVAIRSALVEGNTLSVYAGAGIVPGSEPQQEWDELENKIADFRGILEETRAPRETVQG